MILGPFYLIGLAFIGIVLLVLAYGLFSTPQSRKPRRALPRARGTIGDSGVCPVCGTLLGRGEQIKSAVFPGDSHRVCHIFGCPHCHPYKEEFVKRSCPVCKKEVPGEGYLIARLFERPHNKRHVHILGCTVCRISRKN